MSPGFFEKMREQGRKREQTKREAVLKKISGFDEELGETTRELQTTQLSHVLKTLKQHHASLNKEDKQNAVKPFAFALRSLVEKGFYTNFTATRLSNLFLALRKQDPPKNTSEISKSMRNVLSRITSHEYQTIHEYFNFLNAALARNKKITEEIEKRKQRATTEEEIEGIDSEGRKRKFKVWELNNTMMDLLNIDWSEYKKIYYRIASAHDSTVLHEADERRPKSLKQTEIDKFKEEMQELLDEKEAK